MNRLRYLLRTIFVIPGRMLVRFGLSFYADPAELHEMNIPRWFRAKGDQTYRLNYPLDPASIVFDVGGYHGDWANDIFQKYQSTIHIFEPLPEYITLLQQRFANNSKIIIHSFGLAGKSRNEKIGLLDNASSTYKTNGPTTTAKFQGVDEVFKDAHIQNVDLMKINIEGGEYELLERLIDARLIEKVKDIQVQFHSFVPNAQLWRNKLRALLKKTHTCTYNFPFVWENWKRKN